MLKKLRFELIPTNILMLSCDVSLELWYYTVVILMVGWLKNPEIAVDAVSIWLVPLSFPFFFLVLNWKGGWPFALRMCVLTLRSLAVAA